MESVEGQRPFYPIPFDVFIKCIVPHLNVQDIGRLMISNKMIWEHLVLDYAWEHVKRRCIERVPFWDNLIFASFPWSNPQATPQDTEPDKKRTKIRESQSDTKKFKMPVGGTWYVLKTFIKKLCDATLVRSLINKRTNRFTHWYRTRILDNRNFYIFPNHIKDFKGAVLSPVSFGTTKIRIREVAYVALLCGILPLVYPEQTDGTVYIFGHNSTFGLRRKGTMGSFFWLYSEKNMYLCTSGVHNFAFYTPGFRELFWF